MQGKILADGLISGSDGNRYTYTTGDLKNAQGKSIHSIIGSEVDFEGLEGKASNIYITQTSFNIDDKLFSGDLQSIKIKAYIAIICPILALIPILGFIFPFVAIALQILVIIGLNKGAQSTTLLKTYIISIIIPVVGSLIIFISVWGSIGVNALSIYSSGGISDINYIISGIGVFGVIFGILVALSWWFFMYRYYKELSYITNEPFFMYAFICRIVGYLTFFLFVGIFFLIADLALEIIAWFRTKELRKSYSAIV